MGFGLSKFKEQEEAATTRNESPYFKLGPGEKVRIRPLVELDENAKGYDPKRGTANFVREYVNPVKFWLSVVQNDRSEPNVGADMVKRFGWFKGQGELKNGQHSDKTKNWNPKQRFYLPVVVDRQNGEEPTTEVLQLTFGPKSYSQRFVDQHEAKETIVDRWWVFGRNDVEVGKNGATIADVEYKLVPDDPSDFDFSAYDLPNVNDAPYVNNVPYDDQYAFLQIAETYPEHTAQVTSESVESAPAGEAPTKLSW